MLKDSQLDLCGRVDFARTTPLLARDEAFSFACAGCGGCCRGREDIVLSGFDSGESRAAAPAAQTVARPSAARPSAGEPSAGAAAGPREGGAEQLPLPHRGPLRHPRRRTAGLRPLPAGTGDQQGREVSYFLQPTDCGGRVIEAKVEDYLARYDVPAREKTDVRWAQTCMDLEDVVEPLDAALEPPLRRRMQAKLWQALYFKFDYEKEYLPQLEENLVWLGAELQKLTDYQQRRNAYRKK